MELIDTHTHLYLPEFDSESHGQNSLDGQCEAVKRAIDAGVTKMVFPNVDRTTVEPMKQLQALFPQNTFMAMGLHPTEVKENWEEELDFHLNELRSGEKYVAVGEIGIDLYWDKSFEKQQMKAFDAQVAAARESRLPIIIHCREGLENVLEVLQGHKDVPAVFHSFGGTPEDVDKIRRVGDYYFGINGIVTFKNSRLREVLPCIGAERLLTETDSPYLSPAPMRGQRNESARIIFILQAMASSLGMHEEDLAIQIQKNASKMLAL